MKHVPLDFYDPQRGELMLVALYLAKVVRRERTLRKRLANGRCFYGRRKGQPYAPATKDFLRQEIRRLVAEAESVRRQLAVDLKTRKVRLRARRARRPRASLVS